jgi:hypothetical protein
MWCTQARQYRGTWTGETAQSQCQWFLHLGKRVMLTADRARPLAAFWLLALAAALITGAGLHADEPGTQPRPGSPVRVTSSGAPELVLGGILNARPSPAFTNPLSPDLWAPGTAGTPSSGAVQVASPSGATTRHKARAKGTGTQQATTAQVQASETGTATPTTTGHGKGRNKSGELAKTTTTATATATSAPTDTAHGKGVGKGQPADPGTGH